MKIVYMGTPDFAVRALEALVKSEHEVVAVVTQPDQPKGRGHHLCPPPVKEYALANGLPVFQPLTLKDEAFLEQLREWNPDVAVVCAYGRILPKSVLDFPKYGCINIHASILPRYRGAAPIQRALMNGDDELGITIMQMEEGLDTGDMLATMKTSIDEEDNFESVHDRLSILGAQGLLEVLTQLGEGKADPKKQDASQSTYAAKIEKTDCILDFSRTATELFYQIRALSPIPLAFAYHNGTILKLTSARAVSKTSDAAPGTVIDLAGNVISVACKEGILQISGVVPQGKGRMSAGDFIRGRKIQIGDRLTSALS